jgi:hypothetical protein
MMAPSDAMVCDGGRLKKTRFSIRIPKLNRSYIDIKRIIKDLRSSTTGNDSVDMAFGTHPRAMPGRKRSVI